MDKFEAGQIVRNTLQNSFDKDRFIYFIKNLLNTFDETKAFHAHGYVKEKFKKIAGIIKTYERIGTYTDPEGNKIDILIVYLEKKNSLDRARTTLRNFVADYLKERDMKEGALVAFVSPEHTEWRFSLVKMEYRLTETPAGKIKAKEELTPARRFSFIVGPEEHTHTAQSRLAPIIQDDVNNPTFKQIEEAFSVERVTKEFYAKYRDLFLRLKESTDELINKDEKIQSNFQANNVNSIDFTKKLLGQIVFLYFLQKKGWFGVERDKDWGSGSKQFLRELFLGKHSTYKNFFNDILEPLFYEALRNDRSYDDHYFSRFNCKIPFLNGGLFDPINDYDWIQTDILLDNDLFSNNNHTKEGDVGDGILDIFDRYNFTVKEDEPLEKEVAIDPEMLGKVFENLLEVKDRKSKGTYYTPREIVHYMCQESLINYLVNEGEEKIDKADIETLVRLGESALEHDGRVEREGEETEAYSYKIPESVRTNAQFLDDKLKDIRVCDPAIGSGAFPVGMMNEIVRTRNTLTNYLKDKNNRSVYIFKREAIENSLYGVDIDSGAVEIAKLRLWLSLIVDEQDPKQIKPLPNLDYKIMQGNSLIEFVSIGSTMRTTDPTRNEIIDHFNNSKQEYLTTYDPGKKKSKRNEINKFIEMLMVYDKKRQIENDKIWRKHGEYKQQNVLFQDNNRQLPIGLSESESEKLNILNNELDKLKQATPADHFEWHINFNEIFDEKKGFDIVIGNPPYVGEKGHREMFREIKNSTLGKRFYIGKMDLFYFFFHIALNLLKDDGIMVYITTNYYITATGAVKLRKDIHDRASILKLLNFSELKIFESALGQHNMITMLIKGKKEITAETLVTLRRGYLGPTAIQTILSGKDENTKYYSPSQDELFDDGNLKLTLGGLDDVLDKIKKTTTRLDQIAQINTGYNTGANKLTSRLANKYKIKNQDIGIFIIKRGYYNKIEPILNSEEKQLIKPLYKSSDIYSYSAKDEPNEFFIDITLSVIKSCVNFASSYPNLYKHLLQFKPLLEDRRDTSILKNIKAGYWYITRADRNINMKSGKILVPYRAKKNTFGYSEKDWYGSRDVLYITTTNEVYNAKFLLGITNSRIIYFWLCNRGKRKGDMLELYQEPLSHIPIPQITNKNNDQANKLERIVERILVIKKQNKDTDTANLEKQIDQMVYKLYDLTPEEIEIIEHI